MNTPGIKVQRKKKITTGSNVGWGEGGQAIEQREKIAAQLAPLAGISPVSLVGYVLGSMVGGATECSGGLLVI